MEALLVLLPLLFLASLIFSIVAAVQYGKLRTSLEELRRRVIELESRKEAPAAKAEPRTRAVPPPLPAFLQPPPVAPEPAARSTGFQPVSHRQDADATSVNWESILGVKLFAWIGGLALFLGVVFFVKYAFENNWITPTMRVVAGAIIGIALIFVGILPAVRRYRVPAQSLCATGILILYADLYSAYAFYALLPLTTTSVLMWLVTGLALFLAARIDARSVAWLALVGGFVTPFLFRVANTNPILLFGYVAALDCAIAAISATKRWSELLPAAALGSVMLAFAWAYGVFDPSYAYLTDYIVFLVIEALFLGLCTAVTWKRTLDSWTIAAMAIAGLAPLLRFMQGQGIMNTTDFMPAMLLADAGIIAFATIHRRFAEKAWAMATLVGLALVFTWLGEWPWCNDILFYGVPRDNLLDGNEAAMIASHHLWLVIFRHAEIFLLFAATPYLVGTKKFWPWLIASITGPLQFWFVHAYATTPSHLVRHEFLWLLPVAFALPAVVGITYLLKKKDVDLASGDSRLATQGAAVLTFVSLIFPVQFEREWITLGWALESLGLILLFRRIPNRRLRAVALIVACAAFVRLALNPAVLHYHARARVPIFNWYLYAYGLAALCFFLGARWFGEPREKEYERNASPLLYSLGGIVLFLLLNIEIADYFSIGPTLTFSFHGNFARDMTYSIAWAGFALGLLVIGIAAKVRGARFAAIGLLCLTLAKLFLHDLASLSQLYRIAAFITVAIIVIAASFVYQRFLSRLAK